MEGDSDCGNRGLDFSHLLAAFLRVGSGEASGAGGGHSRKFSRYNIFVHMTELLHEGIFHVGGLIKHAIFDSLPWARTMTNSYGQFTVWVSVSTILKSEPSCTSH